MKLLSFHFKQYIYQLIQLLETFAILLRHSFMQTDKQYLMFRVKTSIDINCCGT